MYSTIKTRIRNSGRHHRLALDLPGTADGSTTPLVPTPVITDIESAGQASAKPTPLYNLPEALAAFQSGTHELDVEPEFVGGNNPRPSGAFWAGAVVSRSKEAPKRRQTFIQVIHDVSNKCLKLKIPAHTRAGNLAAVLEAKERNKEVETLEARHKANSTVVVPERIELPPIPTGLTDLEVKIEFKNDVFAKIYVLLPLAGHRILFIEPPASPSINKHLHWEAWLLYPNFPDAFLKDPKKCDIVPEQDKHYGVLIRHEEPPKGCCAQCCGSEGRAGRAQVQLGLIRSLATTPPPATAHAPAGGFPQVTEAELTLTVLAFVAQMNAMVTSRKTRMITMPITMMSGLLTLVMLILKFTIWKK
ncbi:hypothetical protein BCR44DRAFT_44783 [Catenaria anguillulae PL171]|uniref:Uncharacterized protein n=1 Tax=Catenaria anguillulae PL171 TaxID=765915 RepID=A0A1Y2HM16_9FUNG|nr:hypothetical protein BCR44DRAFT_44783 [Catenaria anguillulae PL171]